MKLLDIPIINRLFNYSWGTFVNKLLIFLLLPVISRSLRPEEFAVYSILLLFASLASHFFQLGLQQSLLTLYYKQPDDSSRLTLISTTWRVVAVNSIFLVALILLLRQPLATILINSTDDFSLLVILTAVMVFFDVFCGLTLVVLNIRQQSREYSILNLTKNLVLLFAVLIFSLMGTLDIYVFFYILAFASAVSFFHSLYFFRRFWVELSANITDYSKFSVPIFNEIIRFGIFMVPATFAVISLQSADRYMLSLLSSRALFDAGIYAIAYKMGMIMSLYTVIFDLLFFPYIMKLTDEKVVRQQLRKLFSFYCVSATMIAVLIILFSREIFLLLDSSYQEGASLVFFGVISMHLRGLSNVLVLGFYILKRSESIALASVLAAGLNVLLNWLWIPSYGMLGAGFASVIAYFFIVIFILITVEKAFKAGYNPVWIVVSLLLMLAVSLFNYSINNVSLLLFLYKIGISIVIIFLAIIYLKKKGYIKYWLVRIREKYEV